MTSQTLAAIEQFIIALNSTPTVNHDGYYVFSIDRRGVKYTRVIRTCMLDCGLVRIRVIFCFIDGDGNIYKPASWKAPAKGIRGTLATVDMSKVDGHGSWLYR
jgi:hypothetical protein